MKKLSIILLSIILCVSFCACSNAKTEDNASSTTVADIGASIARPNDEAESNENTSTTDVGASIARPNKDNGNNKSDVIQNNTTTTKNNNSNNKDKPTKNSNQDPTEQDNIHVNAEDLVGGNYFD